MRADNGTGNSFKDEAALKAHEESAHYKARRENKKGEEEYLAATPDVRTVVQVGGFSSRG